MEFINEVNGDFVIEKRGNMIGLFSYLEEFAGVYARMGLEDIIGSIREYICAPGIKYVKKWWYEYYFQRCYKDIWKRR